MSGPASLPPPYTQAQLNARACVRCGSEEGTLLPDGHVRTEVRPGQSLVWAVVACASHLEADT
jgi:hypothetical protein